MSTHNEYLCGEISKMYLPTPCMKSMFPAILIYSCDMVNVLKLNTLFHTLFFCLNFAFYAVNS